MFECLVPRWRSCLNPHWKKYVTGETVEEGSSLEKHVTGNGSEASRDCAISGGL